MNNSDKNPFAIVEDWLQKLPKSQQKAFKKALLKYFFYENWASLRRRFQHRGKSDSNAIKNHNKEIRRSLYFGFGIPCEDLLEKDEIFTKHSPKLSYLQKFAHLAYHGKRDKEKEEFVNRYVGSLEEFIKEVHQRIWVYDYLGKGRTQRPGMALSHYGEAHDKIFELIEAQLKTNPSMSYLRFLALPTPNYELPEKTYHEKLVDAFIACSPQTFSHICRCFNNYSDQTSFYIAWYPTRTYHYAILDYKYIMSEYYRYNSSRDFVPDLLFIERATSFSGGELNELLNIYSNEMQGLIEKPNRSKRIRKSDIIRAVKSADKTIEDNIKRARKKIEPLEDIDIDLANHYEVVIEAWQSKRKLMQLKSALLKQHFGNTF